MILTQVLLVLLSVTGCFLKEDLKRKLRSTFDDYFKNGKTEELEEVLKENRMPRLFRAKRVTDTTLKSMGCEYCDAVVSSIITARKMGIDRETLFNFLSFNCFTLHIEAKPVCDGLIERLLDSIIYIIDNKNITGAWVCSIILQDLGCKQPPEKDWQIDVKKNKVFKKEFTGWQLSENILHFTDFHYDHDYFPGSNADCEYPVCCSEDLGKPSDNSKRARYWGDYRKCDTPSHTMINAFNHAKNNHVIDAVYFTGDFVDHRVWKTEKQSNIDVIQFNLQLIDQSFPNTPIYPVLGNHEAHPINSYSPSEVTDPKLSIQWLFDLVADEWSKWLPRSTRETILKGGYYTVKVSDTFRIIALNSNVCYIMNIWILYQHEDMYDQLKWLNNVLAEAEKNDENVHILSHVPTGAHDCYTTWAREYRKIINRYSSTIKAIFNGHTHTNEFQLFYNLSNSDQAVAIAFNGGSITTYTSLNPNYIIYETCSVTKDIIDVEHFTYNLTEANNNGPKKEPKWYQLYSFKKVYDIEDMNLDTINELVYKMAANKSLAELYYRNKHKNSDPMVLEIDCGKKCILSNLCEIVTSLYMDNTQCDSIKHIFENSN